MIIKKIWLLIKRREQEIESMWNYPQALSIFYKENLKRFSSDSEPHATISFGSVPTDSLILERNGSAIQTSLNIYKSINIIFMMSIITLIVQYIFIINILRDINVDNIVGKSRYVVKLKRV